MDQIRLKNIKTKISIADILIYFAAGILGILTVWPFIFIFSMSVSDPAEAVRQSVWLFPKGFHLDAYIRVFQNSFLWISYRNTIFYVASGTVLNCIMSVLAAYPLSRKNSTEDDCLSNLLLYQCILQVV
jgi:putative aldouronate transport system permease protein